MLLFHALHVMLYCSSPPGARGFQIYEETGHTPAQATRPAAISNFGLSLHSVNQANTDKENQFVHAKKEEEPMAVDFVSIFLFLWC